MDEYIERRIAINEILTLRDYCFNDEEKHAFSLAYRKLREAPTADVVELKNMKWRPYYYISKAEPPVGGKRQDGWSCSVCGKHSYLRKEICDGCNTVMWTVDVR